MLVCEVTDGARRLDNLDDEVVEVAMEGGGREYGDERNAARLSQDEARGLCVMEGGASSWTAWAG